MKNCYSKAGRICVFIIAFAFQQKLFAQTCPYGFPLSSMSYDTTFTTPSGTYESYFVVPKHNMQLGGLVQVRFTVTMTGIASMFFENNALTSGNYAAQYWRRDTLSGPGLVPSLRNSRTRNYGPYTLAASNGVPFSGPDFIAIGPDTVLQATQMTRTITNGLLLDTFYGIGDLTYRYKIHAGGDPTMVSGDFMFVVATNGSVTIRIEYFFCPGWVLPLNVHDFQVRSLNNQAAKLSWIGGGDTMSYNYEVQVSRDGRNFETEAIINKADMIDGNYQYTYKNRFAESGKFYFRIRQKYEDGYVQYGPVKWAEFRNHTSQGFAIYPNPSSGIVGIKFDNNYSGKKLVLITNAQGQKVLEKEIVVDGPAYRQIGKLQSGLYWVRVTDVTSHLSCVNQLFIK